MSVPVPLEDLAAAMLDRPFAYLLSVGADGSVKVVSVRCASPVDEVLTVLAPGRGSCANVVDRPAVTLLYPPHEPDAMTLLVDGIGEVRGEDVVVTPTSAVLHRSAVPQTS